MLPNMADMFGKISEMQEKMQENVKKVKEQMDSIKIEAESGGGMVKVTANANRKILKITIDPEIIDKNDPEMLEDLVCAAVNKALEAAEEKGREEMSKVTSGMLPNLPGLDLSKFGL